MTVKKYQFRLFVAGKEPNSCIAEKNLRALCLAHLASGYAIEVVDVLQDFESALQAQIMVVPALMMLAPRRVTLFGALTDETIVLAALGLEGTDPYG